MLARGSNGFVCKIRGKEINITATLIGHILDMSIEGDAPTINNEREAVGLKDKPRGEGEGMN